MSQTLGEYAKQKAATEATQAGRAEIMKGANQMIAMGLPLEFVVAQMRELAADATGDKESAEKAGFLVECWIREAYEKKEKEG